MIDLSEVVSDPDFAQDFTVLRTTGAFVRGAWTPAAPTVVPFYGILQPASADELQQLPEADRVIGSISIHSEQQFFETHTTGPVDPLQGTSDIIPWRGQKYRIARVFPWADFGYWYGIGVRMSGQ